MKKIIPALCLLLIFTSFKTGKPKDYIVFSGKIEHATGGYLSLFADKEMPVRLQADGSFSDTLHLATGHYRMMDALRNKITLYLEKGKDIRMTYDSKNFDKTIVFTGEGAPINNYIVRKRALGLRYDSDIKAGGKSTSYEMEPALFSASELKLKEACQHLLSTTTGLPVAFRELEMRNIHYDYLLKISQYQDYQRNFYGKPDFQAPAEITRELQRLDYSNKEDFLFSDSYRFLIDVYGLSEAKRISKAEGVSAEVARVKALGSLQNKFIRDSVLFKYTSAFISLSEHLDSFYHAFMAYSTNEAHRSKMTNIYTMLKRVAPGSPSPKFTRYENFAGGTSSIDDFKGKYLFIDVWATWCGPCVYQFPFLDTVKKEYHEKNIQFVALSIDKPIDHNKWQEYVRENKLGGVQLLADNAFESRFIQDYNIRAIPRFILIDPRGNIVTSNAPRPSDKELRKLLDSLPL